MRTGKHYVTFCISFENVNSLLDFGVVRPIKDLDKICHGSFDPLCWHRHDHKHREQLLAEKTDEWGNDLHCCCFESERGRCFCADWSDEDHGAGDDDDWVGDGWDGMEPLNGIGDCTVGLLLDLNRGTLSVFKDDRMLGVMKEGLTGAYCWYVCCTEATCEVEIERGMPPLTRNDGMVGANGKELDLVVKNLIGCIGGG
ncbi:hypothetical protein THAOC_17941 [Thalassiosira oceanica]|uniref:SPRY domain-containing protein n=1 Tax=Thalassiosira oceanica TaxID=159749 RepID=K0STC7_THAOC|nr:hypothetical protein THAOC_17941 [Thalassiosira oceanica]|eukprot:EJK61552.1 hypothetical protein THAOC_17941 [Thalassiosira oceanica]